MNNLQSIVESILFTAGKPLSANNIAKLLQQNGAEVEQCLNAIAEKQKNSGIVLLESNGLWQFATNPKNSAEVRNFLTAELREKLTDATVETLAIIAYRQPIARSEIEAIRGVNCQYSLRHLLIRGLIQRVANPKDMRQHLYETSIEFLQHIGITSCKDLPEFQELTAKITLPEISTSETPTTSTPEILA